MGMAASQGRLLSMTARLSDLEFSSQSKCQSKIKLAMSTEDITRTYTEALNKTKFVGLTGFNDKGSAEYADLTYDMLTGINSPLAGDYCLTDSSNRILVTNYMKQKFDGKTLEEFLTAFNANNQTLVSPAVYPAGYTEATYNQTATQIAESVAAAQAKVDSTPTTRLQTDDEAKAASDLAIDNLIAADNTYETASKIKEKSFTTNYNDAEMLALCDSKFRTTYARDYNESRLTTLALSPSSATGTQQATTNFYDQMNLIKRSLGSTLVGSLSSQLPSVDSSVLQSAVDVAYTKTIEQFLGYEDKTQIPAVANLKGTNNVVVTQDAYSKDYLKFSVDQQQVIATFLTYFDLECSSAGKAVANFSPAGSPNTSTISGTTTTRSGVSGTGVANKAVTPLTAAELAALKAERDRLSEVFQNTPMIGGEVSVPNSDYTAAVAELTAAKQSQSAFPQNVTPAVYKGTPEASYYTNIYNRMAQGYTTQGDESKTINNKDWLSNQLKNGGLFLEKFVDGKAVDQDLSAESQINEVRDTKDLDIIEAKYNSDLLAIQTKDKRLDMEIKQLDTEHLALQTEVESVKKVIQKNIESSFKTFG